MDKTFRTLVGFQRICQRYVCKMILWMLLLLSFSTPGTFSKTSDVQWFCPNHNPQKTLDLKMLMGKWHIVEIVHHLSRENGHHMPELNLGACPTLLLEQDDYNNIHLTWTEDSLVVYYHVKRTDPMAPGFWVASGPRKEKFVDRHAAFSGTVEVMKAVANHAVLTFCKSDHADSQLFSVVLARATWLPRADTAGVNRMLQHRGLQPFLIKRTCSKGATTHLMAGALLLCMSILFLT